MKTKTNTKLTLLAQMVALATLAVTPVMALAANSGSTPTPNLRFGNAPSVTVQQDHPVPDLRFNSVDGQPIR